MLDACFKVVRFTKDYYVEPNVVWFSAGELVLLINQDKIQTRGNTGWCIVPQNAENWNGCTIQGEQLQLHGYFEETDIHPKSHQSYEHVIKLFSDTLGQLEDSVKQAESYVAELRGVLETKKALLL